jgi:hypothetical protein
VLEQRGGGLAYPTRVKHVRPTRHTMITKYTYDCIGCGEPIDTLWDDNDNGTTNGCLSSPDYLLVADWVFHPKCFDEMLNQYTGDGK